MQNEGKSRKPLLVGIIAAVVVLALLLVLLLSQCTGGGGEGTTSTNGSGGEVSTTGPVETEGYQLYWNLDREEYDGKSEAGMSSRKAEADGYWHIRFFIDGQVVELKAGDRKTVNAIDTKDLMGLTFDENGIISGVLDLRDMPLEKTAWQFFVVSAGGNLIKANSTSAGNGMEALLEVGENTGIYDMTGLSGEKGVVADPIRMDRIYAVSNKAGELTHVFIYSRGEYMNTVEAECEHCGQTVQWSLWNKTDSLPTNGGHYQLQNDIQLTKQPNAAEDAKICLDLNGKRVDGKENSRTFALFNVGAELAVMDSSEGQTGVMAAHGKGDQGMVVWVRYGVLYLYGGTLDASDAATTKNGTAVSVSKDTFFYMHGGEIIGGNSDYTYNESKNTYSAGLGGSMYVAGKFVMNDGLIRDGSANAAITYNAKGEPVYQRGMGGNLFISGTGVVELNGGAIKNGKAGNVGANIYMDGAAELTINDGQIMNGVIYGKGRNGGNVYVSSKATVTMNGGRIYGGVSCNTAGNVYMGGKWIMNGGIISGGRIHNYKTGALSEDNATRNVYVVNGNFQMYGGRIYGGVAVIDTKAGDSKLATVVLSGFATIDGGESSKRNLSIYMSGDQPRVIVGQMLEGSRVGVNTTVGLFTQPCQDHNTDNFFSDIEGADVVWTEKGLALGKLACLCGGLTDRHLGECNGEMLIWAPWTSDTALPTAEGRWYLTKDVTMSTTALLRNDEKSIHVLLDLNGKAVIGPEGQSRRAYSLFENMTTYLEEEVDGKKVMAPNIEGISMQLTVTDSVGTGSITMPGSEVHDQGAVFWGRYNDSVINIYGGTFDASAVNTTGSAGGMGVLTQGELNMYGGTFVGGNSSAAGGVVYLQGSKAVFNMEGGTIRGGISGRNGGNVYIQKGATMNMSGGTIEAGSINKDGTMVGDLGYGGNIYVQGTLNMSGDAVVTGGYVRTGVSGTDANGKAISGGGGLGGNIAVEGTANLSGGTVSGGDASVGGNIGTVFTGAVIKLNGVQVLDGKAGNGGNIAINVRANKLLEIAGKTLISGGEATNYGGNIYAGVFLANNQDVTINITGGTIVGGTSGGAEYGGGNIYLHNASTDSEDGETKAGRNIVTITGGSIEGGEAFRRGGNIFLRSKTDVVLDGGTITGGTCGVGNTVIENGGSIAVSEGSTFTMKSGSVTGGTATDIAGNIYINRGTLTISGGVISGGTANQADAANIGCVNGSLVISGGTIEGGVAVTNTAADSCSVTLSGKPYVYNEETGSGIKLRATSSAFKPTAIKVEGELTEGSKVAINAVGYFSLETKESNKQYFLSAIADREVFYDDSRLFIGLGACLCGSTDENHPDWCDKELLLWQDWNGSKINEDGNYIVTRDYTGEALLNGQIEVTAKANLNLNGKTLGSKLRALWLNGGTLGITDHVGGGTVVGRGRASAADIGGTVLISSGTVNVYRGTLTLDQTHNHITYGGVAFVTGTLNLYDEAVVVGGDISETGSGGALYIGGGTVTLDGGRIEGGSAQNGGNVYINSGGSFTMKDGTVEKGTALSGGNVFVNGGTTFTMNGGTISGGEVSRVGDSGGMGGNVYVAINATVSISGTVTDGAAYKADSPAKWAAGGNLFVSGTLTLTNATVSGGCTDSQGQNIYINTNGAVTVTDSELLNDADTDANIFMKGGILTVTGSSLTSTGTGSRNIYTNGDAKATITLNAGTTVSGGKATGTDKTNGLGGNIYAAKDTTVTLNGATVENGSASRNGGNVYIGGEFIMESGAVSGGTALSGGNIFVGDGGSLTMNDGTVTGGEVTRTADSGGMGGNVYVAKGSMAYISGTVTGGKAYKGETGWSAGGNLYLVGNTTLENLTVSNGYTDNDGHNIYVNGNVTAKNCSLENNAGTGANILLRSGSLETEDTLIKSTGTGSRNIHTNGEAVVTVTLNKGTVVSGGNTAGSGGNIFISKQATVTINGATVENGTAAVNGGNIYTSSDSELVVNDGSVITGGTTLGTGSDQGFGGNICVAGTVTINGGTVENGTASTRGGNLYLTGTAVGTMNDGTIQNGTAANAGNIYVNGTLKMLDGTVSGGRNTSGNGGSIFIGAAGSMEMSGGTVKDGSAANMGGNFYVNGELLVSGTAYITGGTKGGNADISGNIYVVNGTLDVSGGVIDGDVTCTQNGANKCVMNLSGKPVIRMGKSRGLYLTLYGGDVPAMITVKDSLQEGSEIYISCSHLGKVISTNAVAQEILDNGYIKAMDPSVPLARVEADQDVDGDGTTDLGKLVYGARVRCVCGSQDDNHLGDCGGKLLLWKPWTDSKNAPSAGDNYYLMTDIDSSAQVTIGNDTTLRVDLNGYTITKTAKFRVWRTLSRSNVTLVITDTSASRTGRIVDANDSGSNQGLIWMSGTNTHLKIYGGTIDAKDRTMTGGNGNAITVTNGNTATMYGGVVIGGYNAGNGGAVCVQGTGVFTQKGGTITGGQAGKGGNVALVTGGTFILEGGTIGGEVTVNVKNADGTIGTKTYKPGAASTNGGNIYIDVGTVELKGGTVKDGAATEAGGNIYVAAGGSLTISGATVEGGTAPNGGSIYTENTVTLSSGTVTGGIATENGGNIYVASTGSLNLPEGCTVVLEGGKAEAGSGGNVYTEGGLVLKGGTITVGRAKTGGNLYINPAEQVTITMENTTISDGYSSEHGGNIYLRNANFVMERGAISGGKAKQRAGNVFLHSGSFTMNGGNITGGESAFDDTVKRNGGSINVNSAATFTITGGKISGGKSNDCGGNFFVGGTLNVSGTAVIEGGVANQTKTANIYLVGGATLNLSGGTVQGGVTAREYNNAAPQVNLSGAINLNTDGTDLNLDNAGGDRYSTVNIVGDLTGSSIGITAPEGHVFAVGSSAHTLTYADKAFFSSDNANLQIVLIEGEGLKLVSTDEVWYCECAGHAYGLGDHVCYDIPWTAWTSETSLPTSEGNYYLTGTVASKTNTPDSNEKIRLDLNGFEVTTTKRLYCLVYVDGYYYSQNAYVSITNSKTTGGITSTCSNNQGCVFWITTGDMNLYGVNVDATGVEAAQSGAVFYVSGGHQVNMYGGTIKGGTTAQNGGAVYLTSTGTAFNMYGNATIDGGTANNGGAVYVNNGTLTMNGEAVVKNGYASYNSGNIHVGGGKLTVNDNAQILDGKAKNVYGNVYVGSAGTMVMNGGKISGGVVYYGVTSGKNTQTDKDPRSNLCLLSNATFEMTSGEITGYVFAHAYAADSAPNITISGDAKIYGGDTNLYLTVTGGKVFAVTFGDLLTSAEATEGGNYAQIGMNFSKHFTSGMVIATGIDGTEVGCITPDNNTVVFVHDETENVLSIQ